MADNSVTFTDEDAQDMDFYVIEETKVNGFSYLLVCDEEDMEQGNVFILKDISAPEEEEAIYDVVQDEVELQAVSKVFSELVDGIDIEIEETELEMED
ncbi:MAG: DUF1292 domain-containing protein [Clostridiales bacterium]|nr:DUF1292 domain-containing protein [Clostridiales bacterium]